MKKRAWIDDLLEAWPSVMVAIGLGLIVAHLVTDCGHG
jgi:hypothetical protein